MKPEVPDRLFAADGEAFGRALRRAVRETLNAHKLAGNWIATWEDGSVVLVPAEAISTAELNTAGQRVEDVISFETEDSRRRLLADVKKISVEGDIFCVSYRVSAPHLIHSLGQGEEGFVQKFVPLLRELCRELTGRDRDIRIDLKGPDDQNFSLTLARGEALVERDMPALMHRKISDALADLREQGLSRGDHAPAPKNNVNAGD